MDEQHLLAAARYVEMNLVDTDLVEKSEDYRWSSTSAYLAGQDDGLVQVVAPLLDLTSDWKSFLQLSFAQKVNTVAAS